MKFENLSDNDKAIIKALRLENDWYLTNQYRAFRLIRHLRDNTVRDPEAKKFMTRVMRRLRNSQDG